MTQGADTAREGGHVHLHIATRESSVDARVVATGAPAWDWARWPILGAGVLAGALFAASFFVPWWQFWLYAPQYPKGLSLVISLTGMGGDVGEIDVLNHYIGMKHLAGAAPMERHLAGYGVAAIAVTTLVMLAVSGRKLNMFVAMPAIAFPVVFVADSFYWLYSFGHQLDPHAPLKIGAFTPQMFGNGQIGQFETFARPGIGFWLAIAGVACALLATFLRSRVCAHCSHAGTCSAVCPHVMVLHDPRKRVSPPSHDLSERER